MTIATSIRELPDLVIEYLQCNLVPMITGSPGIGKSDVVRQVAQNFNLKVIDLRLAQMDPVDMMGFASRNDKTGKGYYLPMETFPLESDPIPAGYAGWLLFLDELTSAKDAIQAAAYKVILDRMVGSNPLHKNVAIVAAGNKESDNAIVQPMSSALKSRMVHLEVEVNPNHFCEYASAKGWDQRIISYLNFRPDNVYTFKPDSTGATYACPRTWEFANRLMPKLKIDSLKALTLLAGCLDEGVAREFQAFCAIRKELPDLKLIMLNPEHADIPEEPSVLWALCGEISAKMTTANAGQLVKYLRRVSVECRVISIRQAVKRLPILGKEPEIEAMIIADAAAYF
jgi:hypothetical protein